MIHNDISKKSDKYKAVAKVVKRFLEVNTKLADEGYSVQDRHFAIVNLAAHFTQWVAVETEIQNSEQIKRAGFKTVQDYMNWMRSLVITISWKIYQ